MTFPLFPRLRSSVPAENLFATLVLVCCSLLGTGAVVSQETAPEAEAPSLSRTTRTLESIFGNEVPSFENSLAWPEMDDNNAVYRQGDRWVIWNNQPEQRGSILTFPFSGSFDISARIDVEKLESGMLEAGIIGIFDQGKKRYSILKTARGNVRVRDDYGAAGENVLGVFGHKMMENFPWVRVRNLNGWITVMISHDGFAWRERVRVSTPSKHGRLGLAVFGEIELGARCGVFEDFRMIATVGGGKVVRFDNDLVPNDKDKDGLPDDYESLLGDAPEAERSKEADFDRDGTTNWDEYLAHTSPADPEWKPFNLPEQPRTSPGMLLEKWFMPSNVHAVGAIPSYRRNFPQGAREALVLTSLKNGGFGAKPTAFRMITEFSPEVGGFYEFQLAGVRNGQVTLRELHADPTKKLATREEIVLSVNGAQRFGSGSLFLKQTRFYRLEVIALHRDEASVPVLNWFPPGAREMTEFSPKEPFIPAIDPDDLDRDGLPDSWEDLAMGHRYEGAYGDPDRDGLTNNQEWFSGSDPTSADSDSDEVPDLFEESTGEEGIVSASIKPTLEVPKNWNFAWIPPDQKPLGSDEFRAKPDRSPIFHSGEPAHYLLAPRNTYRGNRIDWIPYVYKEVEGDFDVMTFVDFPASKSENAIFRSAAGGLMAREAVGGDSRFEIAFCVSNTGELMIRHIPDPATGIKPYYENQYGGDTAWKHQKLWIRLIRRGNRMVCAWSPDREVWIQTSDPLRAVDGPLLIGTYALGGTAPSELAVRFRTPEFFDPDQFAQPVYDKSIRRWNDCDLDDDGIKDWERRAMGLSHLDWEDVTIEVNDVARLEADASTVDSGNWVAAGARGMYCQLGHGTLRFQFDVPQSGIYRALIETAPALNYGGGEDSVHKLEVQLDGNRLDTVGLQPRNDGMSEFPVVLPALGVGKHEIVVRYFSPRAARSLPIRSLSLERFTFSGKEPEVVKKKFNLFGRGTAESAKSKDPAAELLQSRNSLPSGEIASAVSPAFIEGTSKFPDWVTAKVGEEALETRRGIDGGWFANVLLEENGATEVALAAENGLIEEKMSIAWKETNILDGGTVTLRRGDSLKLVAPSAGEAKYQITVGERLLGESRPEPYSFRFDEAGIQEVRAKPLGEADGPGGMLRVEVVDPRFASRPVVLKGRRRTWINPQLDLSQLKLEADASLAIQSQERELPGSKSLALSGARDGIYHVQVRLPSGVIAAQSEVEVVSLYHATETAIDRINLGGQGRIMTLKWAVPRMPDSLRMQVRLIAGTGLFSDGSIVKTLTHTELDSTNRFGISALQPAGETRALCHHVYIFDGETYIGSL